MSTAVYLRRPGGREKHLYVVVGTAGDGGSRVVCENSDSGARTLPVLTSRKAARRFLRASPLRFNLLGSGWRTRRITGAKSGILLVRPPMASSRSHLIRLPSGSLVSVPQNR